ncbi:hypothetical protein BDN72DRAFT_794763 [Pluteus cervinus]|uniref:Uncharacterized protein n=1 Tax=Pluteus cervinus TaxID=181527 RepID=A0ACD3AZ47_9AGAR|nr:hypothetical protein BDN72DRAFT_794763 [Pluteus cervinus]
MFSALLVISLFAPSFIRAAPISTLPLDAEQLKQNGLQAQELNAIFATFNLTDTCTTGDVSCINGATASCVGGAWQAKSCTAPQQCFVLPSTISAGTVVGCALESDALSSIQATGVPGGLTPLPTNEDSTSESSTSASEGPSATATASDDSGLDPITVTVTLTQPIATSPPTTRTLSPSDASVLLSSLTSGQFTSVIISSPSATVVGNSELPEATDVPLPNSSDGPSSSEEGTEASAIITPSSDSPSVTIDTIPSETAGPKDQTKTISILPTQTPTDLPASADDSSDSTDDASADAPPQLSPTETIY